MKNKYLLVIISLFLFSCEPNIHDKIYSKIENNCKGLDTCIIDISDVIDFKWDKMYIFGEWCSPGEINRITGLKYSGKMVNDGFCRILFIYENKIVYEEDNESFGLEFHKSDKDDETIEYFTNQIKFKVIKNHYESESRKGQICYSLYPVDNEI